MFFLSELIFAHVRLIYPIDNESFELGEKIVIEWEILVDHGSGSWTLEYTIDGGNNWVKIISELSQEKLSFEWTIPQMETENGGVRVTQVNDNEINYTSTASILKFNLTTSINNESSHPQKFVLNNVYPNPFNNSTMISYQLPKPSNVELIIYDINGREVEILENKLSSAGNYNILWETEGISSGTYIILLKSNNLFSSKKIVLLK